MNWLVGLAFAIPMVLINGFVLVMAAGIIGLGGPFGKILGCGFLISLIPGFLALLIRGLAAPPPPIQKQQSGDRPPQPSALTALRNAKEKRRGLRDELPSPK